MSPTTPAAPQHPLVTATEHHRAGRLKEAELLYRRVLAVQPDNASALNLLGVIASQVGRHDDAVGLIGQAAALAPDAADVHSNLATALLAAGHVEQAVSESRRAVELDESVAAAHNTLASCLRRLGRLDEALPHARRAVELQPGFPEALNNLGSILSERGDVAGALDAYRDAVTARPAFAEAQFNLGRLSRDAGRFDEAAAALGEAVRLKPDDAAAQTLLGDVLRETGRYDEAAAAQAAALALTPDDLPTRMRLAAAHRDAGRLDEALAEADRAIEGDPENRQAKAFRALILLTQGDYERGWKELESRWGATPELQERTLPKPRWERKSRLEGRTILLTAEQGLGDTLQFIRYAPLLTSYKARVVVECQPPLKSLIESAPGVSAAVAQGEELPAYDKWCPMLSLPYEFRTKLAKVPADVPYLAADGGRVDAWWARVGGEPALKVGLVWAGSAANPRDRQRSAPPEAFAALANVPGVRFYSLQKRDEVSGVATAGIPGLDLIDYTDELHDFADTAALVSCLDLVISVDTAVAHLAGAMGRPVWTLLPFAAEWRWMLGRDDTPWYPTMRLFRQTTPGDWAGVLARVAAEMPAFAAERAGGAA